MKMIFLDAETNNTLHPFMSDFETTWFGRSVIEATVFVLYFVLSVTQNSMILVAVYRSVALRIVPFMFIANLASTDILLSTSFPFYAVTRITRHWIFGNVLCKSVFYSSIVQAMCSSFTLILISIDRYYCVTINSSWIKRKQIALLLLFVWALSFALSVPSLYSRGAKTVYLQNETFVICTNEWSGMSHSALNSFHTLILFFFLFGPSTTMMVMYFKLYQFIRRAKLRVIQQRSQSKKITKRHVRLVKMFTIIVLLYFMRLLPWLISSVMRMYFSVSSAAHVLALLTSFSTTCLNPIIYGYNNKLLRNGIRRTLCCK